MARKLLKIFLYGLLVYAVIFTAGFWYVKNVFFPNKLKPLLIETIQKSAGIKIDFKDISYSFPDYVSINKLAVFEKNTPGQKLLSAERLALKIGFFDILFKKCLKLTGLTLETLTIYPGPGRSFTSTGDVSLSGEFIYNLKEPYDIFYKAVLTLKKQEIKNISFINELNDLNGQINIQQDKISIIWLKANSYGCPVEFSGYLENFKDPYLDLKETIDIDLSKLNNFLPPKIGNAIKPAGLAGKSIAAFNISGKINQPPLKFNGRASLIDAEIKLSGLANPIKYINGGIAFDENTLSLSDIKAQYNGQLYNLKANITNFASPSIYAALSSNDLLLEAKITAAEDYLRLESIEGKLFNSDLSLTGELQNYANPRIKLSGEGKLSLEDIQNIILRIQGPNEKTAEIFKWLKPRGIYAVSLFADGLVKNFTAGELGLKADSNSVSLYGLNLGPSQMDCQLKDKVLFISKLSFAPYAGQISAGCVADFTRSETTKPSYTADINITGIDLAKLTKDTALKDKNIWGTLSSAINLKGEGADSANLKGGGWVIVADGRLWEIPLLGGIAQTMNLPMLSKIEIKESRGNFSIKDKKLSTENLQFTSPQLNMLVRGALGFDKGLDFTVGLSFAPGFAEENQLARIAMLLADQTGRFMGELKITGSLEKPKYKFMPLGIDKILKNLFRMP